MEQTPFGDVVCRARNPLALKTLMQLLGLPSQDPAVQPLGKMSRAGLDVVVNIAKTVQSKNPEILAPLAEFFNVDIDARLNDLNGCWRGCTTRRTDWPGTKPKPPVPIVSGRTVWILWAT
jgi:4-hydroxy-tetrahydrodipicolinate synthase